MKSTSLLETNVTSSNDGNHPHEPTATSSAPEATGESTGELAEGERDVVQRPSRPPTAKQATTPPSDDSVLAADAAALGFGVVGIGASAGGLEAFTALLEALPNDTGLAFVLVPHLDPTHRSLMAQLLGTHTSMRVEDARDGVTAAPNRVYLIPPGKFMTIDGGALHLTEPPKSMDSATGRQTAIDSFLRSLALDMQHRAVGIILSGTSNHGTIGLREIKDRGGLTLVQAPDSARFPQMPQSAVDAGIADQVLTPADMAAALSSYARSQQASGAWLSRAPEDADQEKLLTILGILRARTKYDFRGYRKNMLLRRVRRRMGLSQVESLSDYVDKLREDANELGLLFHDMLIGVTSFFRDVDAFDVLEQRVLEGLAESADIDHPVRVWVPGCATGEEAYSIAMLLIETFARFQRSVNLQLFATDIDESALEIARQAIYPEGIATDVSPERLKRFFTSDGSEHYRLKKEVRETVVFAPQNLIGDAPFSRMDLISCRNLLIYLEPEVQHQVIALFHFALRPKGYLLLGSSESIGPHGDLFETLSRKWRLFRRAGVWRYAGTSFPTAQITSLQPNATDRADSGTSPSPEIGQVAQRILLDEYSPAAVLVSPRFEILYFFGAAVNYLDLPTGRPTLYLMDLLRQGLRTGVRAACHRATRDQTTVDVDDASVERDGRFLRVHARVRPLTSPKHMRGMLLITFTDVAGKTGGTAEQPADEVSPQEIALAQQLELELRNTREELQSNIEEFESANEELKASNEEAISANEELQSANEELETSKEELQSLNEELTTVNNQLEEKVQELEHSNNDISNLLTSTDIATIFLDTEMNIQRFTPQIVKLLNIRPSDTGRPLTDLSANFTDDSLLADARHVLERLTPVEQEISIGDEAHYLRRIQPYRTSDNHINGVVITFIDITLRSNAEAAVRASEARYRMLFDRSPMNLMEQNWSGVRQCLERRWVEHAPAADLGRGAEKTNRLRDWVLAEPQGSAACQKQVRIKAINQATLRLLGVDSPEQVRAEIERYFPANPTLEWQHMLAQLLSGRSAVREFEICTQDGKRIPTLLHAVPAYGYEKSLERVMIAVIDISQRKRMEQDLANREQRLSAILNTVADGIVGVDRDGIISEFNAAAERLFNCPASEAIGQRLKRFLLPAVRRGDNDNEVLRQLIKSPGTSHRPTLCEGIRTDGALFPAEMIGAEIDHLGIYVLLVRDISQRRELERQIINTSTREQERIGREIHDGLGQQLTAVALLAATLASKLDKAKRPEAAEARALARHLDQALIDSKGITQGLAPVGVSPERLIDALSGMAAQIAQSSGVRCELADGTQPTIDDPVIAAHLYRIAQEAVSNAARHGRPTKIEIRLEQHDDWIRLSVRDDGEWQDQADKERGGLGLHIMGYRAGTLGGTLSVRPQPDGGTLMLCEVPLLTG